VNESGTIPLLVHLFEVDYERTRVMFCVSEDLGTKEGNDMIRDDFTGLFLKVGIVYSEVGVEPIDFVSNKTARDETLGGPVSAHSQRRETTKGMQ